MKYGQCLLVHCNYDIKNLETRLAPFYRECLKQWQQVLISMQYRQTPATQMIWNNHKIKRDGKSVYFSDFREAGLWIIADLYDNGTLRDFKFWQGKRINANRYMGWRPLIAAVPHSRDK